MMKGLLNRARLRTAAAAILLAAAVPAGVAAAADGPFPALEEFHRKSVAWQFRSIGAEVALSLYCDDASPMPERGYRYGVFYIRNGNFPRIGTEPDEKILRDLLTRDGHWVMVVDLGRHPKARTPDFDDDLLELYRAIYRTDGENPLAGSGLSAPRYYRVFFVPAGYRLAVDRLYYDLREHAPAILAETMKLYNELADRPTHRKFAIRKVERPEEMVDRYGRPLDYRVRFDIIYPAAPERPAPLFALYNSGWENAAHYPPDPIRIRLTNFLFRGYAYANIHYPISPTYRAFERPAHRDASEVAHRRHAYAAAIRKLRTDAAQYHFDPERIGVAGLSKSAPVAAILGDPRCASRLAATPMPVPQPWPGVSSRVACVAMFNGNLSRDWLVPGFVPAFYGRSELDPYVGIHAAERVRGALEKAGVPHLALIDMTDLPHTFPGGRDSRLGGVDRDRLLRRFFDRQLGMDDGAAPELLFHLPADGAEDLPPETAVELYFFPAVQSVETPADPARLEDARGRTVAGVWKRENGGMRFRFVPDAPLPDGMYRMSVGRNHWRSAAGAVCPGGETFRFRVDRAAAAVAPRPLFPVRSVEMRDGRETRYDDFKSHWPTNARGRDGAPATMTYDLGRECRVDRLEPQFADTRWEGYYFDVDVSGDGAAWDNLLTRARGRYAEPRLSIPVNRKIRFLRLTARPNEINHFFMTGLRIMGY